MSGEPSIFFADVNERQGSFLRRTFVFGGLATLGVAALVGRLAQLQVVQAQEYATLSSQNQFNFRMVPPPRGLIKDRNGVVIAGNRPSFRVLVVRDERRRLLWSRTNVVVMTYRFTYMPEQAKVHAVRYTE